MSYPHEYLDYRTQEGEKKLFNIYKNPGVATMGQINAIMMYYDSGALNKNNK